MPKPMMVAESIDYFAKLQNPLNKKFARAEITFHSSSRDYGIFSELHPNLIINMLKIIVDQIYNSTPDARVEITMGLNYDDTKAVVDIFRKSNLEKPGKYPPLEKCIDLRDLISRFNAFKVAVEIDSLGFDEYVVLEIPMVLPSESFIPIFSLRPNQKVMVCVDKAEEFEIWKKSICEEDFQESNLVHYSNLAEVTSAIQNESSGDTFFVVYDNLGEAPGSGLQLIRDYSLENKSLLVTCGDPRRPDDRNLGGVKLTSDIWAGELPIEVVDVPKVEAILIEDLWSVHTRWKRSAKIFGKKFKSFMAPGDFLKVKDQFPPQIPIHIDSRFRCGQRGEIFAKEIFDQGFKNITLATHYEPESFSNMPWIKNIAEKAPPWESKGNLNPKKQELPL